MTIDDIKKEILSIGPVLPGSLSKQLMRCGKSNCKCANGGKRHGPYWQLSWTVGSKSGSKYVKADQVPEIKERIKNYKKLQSLLNELLNANLQLDLAAAIVQEEKKDE